MKQLLDCLKPLKKRIHLKYLISTVLAALTAAFAANTVLVLLSKLVFIYGIEDIIAVCTVLILATGLVVWQFTAPSDYKTAKAADSLGYKERFVTAYEVLSRGGDLKPMERLTVGDAIACGEKADFKALYPIKPNKYLVIAPIIALVLLFAAYFLPIEPSQRLIEQQELHEMLDDTVEKMTEKIDNNASLTDKQKKEIKKEIKTLKKELSKAGSKQEAANTLMQGQTKLKKIEAESQNAAIKEIGGRLAENQATQNLGELLQSGNIEAFNEAVENINNDLANMNEEQIKELGKAFKDAAQCNNIDAETKELLNDLADTMDKELTPEQMEQVRRNLSELSDTLNELAKENQDIREAIEQLNSDLAKAEGELSQGAEGIRQGQNLGQNPEQGQGQAQGQNLGQAQGQGQAQSQEPGGGNGRGSGSIPNANVYTSQAKGYSDYEAELNGNDRQGTGERKNNRVNGGVGESVPYTEVYQEYKNEALNGMEQENIPYGVQDIVRDYFSSLE